MIKEDSGSRAVEIFTERHDEIGVVLMDMMMPEREGCETFCALKKIRKDVKVLFVSGYGEETKFTSALEEGALGVCNKPIDGSSLVQIISEVLAPGGREQSSTIYIN